jgi:hypothetical protein
MMSSIFFEQQEQAETASFIDVSEPSAKRRLLKCSSEVVDVSAEPIERHYTMVRVRAGDYLLPSNDGKTIWRIKAYDEDGSAEYGDGTKVYGRFWGIWKYIGRDATHLDPYEWDRWAQWDSGYNTRAEAVQRALRVAL